MIDLAKGIQTPIPMNDNEINDMKNLKKKVDYLRDQIEDEDEQENSHSEDEDDEDEDVDIVQPKKKNIKV